MAPRTGTGRNDFSPSSPMKSKAPPAGSLEHQLREWRRDLESRRAAHNPGLLVPPRMSLHNLDKDGGSGFQETRSSASSSPSRGPRSPTHGHGPLTFAPLHAAQVRAEEPRSRSLVTTVPRGLLTIATAPHPDAVAPQLPGSLLPRRPLSPLSPSRLGVGTTSAPYPQLRSEMLTEPRGGRPQPPQGLQRPTFGLGQPIGLTGANLTNVRDVGSAQQRFDREGPRSPTDQEEPRRRLQQVRQALAEREQELRELHQTHAALASDGEESEGDGHPSSWQVRTRGQLDGDQEAAEVLRLQQALRQTNERVAMMEAQLRREQQHSDAATGANSHWTRDAPSDVSTAASSAVAAAMADSHWHDRAQALDREIRSEAAIALDVQDRIHWLRAQLRKPVGVEDERIIAINDLLGKIADKVGYALPSGGSLH